MVKFICDISTSGRDRNMKISILMFGFMGIPVGYSFSRSNEKWLNGKGRNGNSACGEASKFAPRTPDTSSCFMLYIPCLHTRIQFSIEYRTVHLFKQHIKFNELILGNLTLTIGPVWSQPAWTNYTGHYCTHHFLKRQGFPPQWSQRSVMNMSLVSCLTWTLAVLNVTTEIFFPYFLI
jgi:hypothetical protein